jgi:hypothetical protein
MRYHVVLHLLNLIWSNMEDFTSGTAHEYYDEMMVSAYAVYRQCDRKGEDEVKKLIVDITQMHDDHKHSDLCLFDLKL